MKKPLPEILLSDSGPTIQLFNLQKCKYFWTPQPSSITFYVIFISKLLFKCQTFLSQREVKNILSGMRTVAGNLHHFGKGFQEA